MILTEDMFRQMMPNGGHRLDAHWPYINEALAFGNLTTPRVIAMFMAQVAHESGEYRYMEEIADGSQYEWRQDLGNTQPGDGVKFKGHGPIQVTGRANHKLCGDALGMDLIEHPTLICQPEWGTKAAVWFWNYKHLSPVAEADDIKEVTRRINGGLTHLAERADYWQRNRTLLGLPPANIMMAPIRRGDTGTRVVVMQQKLGLQADGVFGRDTEAAVIAYQREHGLDPDGVVGPATAASMGL